MGFFILNLRLLYKKCHCTTVIGADRPWLHTLCPTGARRKLMHATPTIPYFPAPSPSPTQRCRNYAIEGVFLISAQRSAEIVCQYDSMTAPSLKFAEVLSSTTFRVVFGINIWYCVEVHT